MLTCPDGSGNTLLCASSRLAFAEPISREEIAGSLVPCKSSLTAMTCFGSPTGRATTSPQSRVLAAQQDVQQRHCYDVFQQHNGTCNDVTPMTRSSSALGRTQHRNDVFQLHNGTCNDVTPMTCFSCTMGCTTTLPN